MNPVESYRIRIHARFSFDTSSTHRLEGRTARPANVDLVHRDGAIGKIEQEQDRVGNVLRRHENGAVQILARLGDQMGTNPSGQDGGDADAVRLRLNGQRQSQTVVSAVTRDGLDFEMEPGVRLQDKQSVEDSMGITAAEAISPAQEEDDWIMFYSAWQDVPPGTVVPLHPASDPNAEASGSSENFAVASIAVDLSGYRSRIFAATSGDGLTWQRAGCVIE